MNVSDSAPATSLRLKTAFGEDLRVITLGNPPSFRALCARISELYGISPSSPLILKYKDLEGDLITIAGHQDLVEAFASNGSAGNLRVIVSVGSSSRPGSQRSASGQSHPTQHYSSPHLPRHSSPHSSPSATSISSVMTEGEVPPVQYGQRASLVAQEGPNVADHFLLDDVLREEWRSCLSDKKRNKLQRRQAKRERKQQRRAGSSDKLAAESCDSGSEIEKKEKPGKKARREAKRNSKLEKREQKLEQKLEKKDEKRDRKMAKREVKMQRKAEKYQLPPSPLAYGQQSRAISNRDSALSAEQQAENGYLAPSNKKAVKMQRRAAKLEHLKYKQEKLAARCLSARLVRLDQSATGDNHLTQEANAKFVKTLRLRNDGSATWPQNCFLAFVPNKHSTEADRMGGPNTIVVPVPVASGQMVELGLPLIAPASAGRYVGSWQMHSPSGHAFGQDFTIKLYVTGGSQIVTPASIASDAQGKAGSSIVYRDPYLSDDPYLSVEARDALLRSSVQNAVALAAEKGSAESELVTPTIASMLRSLRELGFVDTARNLRVLQRHDMRYEAALAELQDPSSSSSIKEEDKEEKQSVLLTFDSDDDSSSSSSASSSDDDSTSTSE